MLIDKTYAKLNELDKNNQKIKQQLMNLAAISKVIKADLEKYKGEIVKKKSLSSKQKEQRSDRAEKREGRHRAMRQGINDMLHDQMKLVD